MGITGTVDELHELMTKKEDLHPDLVWHLEYNEATGWWFLKHPLVFSVPYNECFNAMLNAQYIAKKEMLHTCLEKKDWHQYIFLYERPYRCFAFRQIMKKLTNVEYWDLLGSIWSDSENIWQNYSLLKRFLNSKRSGKENFMDDDERKMLADLPNEIRVYRGHMGKNQRGLSWSFSSHAAGWFGQRFAQKNGGVVTGLVSKDKIKAVLLGRNEYEVVVDPKDVQDQKPFLRVPENTDPLKKVFLANWAQAPLRAHGRTDHGIHHWHKVDHNGIILAGLTPGADLEVVRLFAAFHDSQRVNENHDPKHGERGAKYFQQQVQSGGIYLNSEKVGKVVEAVLYHEKGMVSDDPTIGVCWDADRLDLVRVGIIPRAELMSTEAGKNLICRI
jgi:hypothetical protein